VRDLEAASATGGLREVDDYGDRGARRVDPSSLTAGSRSAGNREEAEGRHRRHFAVAGRPWPHVRYWRLMGGGRVVRRDGGGRSGAFVGGTMTKPALDEKKRHVAQ
jgi:hypothetical protein